MPQPLLHGANMSAGIRCSDQMTYSCGPLFMLIDPLRVRMLVRCLVAGSLGADACSMFMMSFRSLLDASI
jgi:hypothetical protein